MVEKTGIEVRLVDIWDVEMIADLYRAGGWWNEIWDPTGLGALIAGSFAFAVAIDSATGRAVGMGRYLRRGLGRLHPRPGRPPWLPGPWHRNDDLINTAGLL